MRTIHAMYWSATDTTKTVVRTIAQTLAQHAGNRLPSFRFYPARVPRDGQDLWLG